MAKTALISAIKNYCCEVGKVEDNNDDVCLHYIDVEDNNVVAIPDFSAMGEVKITKVGYDKFGEYDELSGVMVWVERTTGHFPNNIVGIFNAEERSFQMLAKVVELLSMKRNDIVNTQSPDTVETLTNTLAAFFAGEYEHNLYAANAPLDISINGINIDCESVWVDEVGDYFLHVTNHAFEGDIKILSLSEDNMERVIKCLEQIMKENK